MPKAKKIEVKIMSWPVDLVSLLDSLDCDYSKLLDAMLESEKSIEGTSQHSDLIQALLTEARDRMRKLEELTANEEIEVEVDLDALEG